MYAVRLWNSPVIDFRNQDLSLHQDVCAQIVFSFSDGLDNILERIEADFACMCTEYGENIVGYNVYIFCPDLLLT